MPLDLTNSPNSIPIGNPAKSNPSISQGWFNTCTLQPGGGTQNCVGSQTPVWAIRGAQTLQTWSTRLANVRNPGVRNVDMSVMKNIQFTQRFGLLFRTDFINSLNSPQFFSGPVSDVNSANFGKIAGAMDQSNLPRFIQFSLKAEF